MHKVALTGFATAVLLASATAHAQPAPAAPSQQATTINLTIQPMQWLVVGAGVLVGSSLLHIVLPRYVAFVVGGAIGGYLADAWYQTGDAQMPSPTR